MAKKLRRAFTIVELVIVIAVIAILAAVLIPTFTTLIDKANQSADTSNVKNMNSILAMDETTNGKPKTMFDAVKVIREGGYDLEKLTPTGRGYDIVWDQDANRLLMVNGNEVIFGETEKNANEKHLWVVVDSAEKIAATGYSVYLTDVFKGTVEAKQGVDVGSNEDITTVTYNPTEKQNVTIRTDGGALVVDAELATVSHYGAAASVDIQKVADESYHEYGTVAGNITLKQGRFVAEDKSSAAAVVITAETYSADNKTVEVVINANSAINSVAATNTNVAALIGEIVDNKSATTEVVDEVINNETVNMFAGGVGTESSPYLISSAEELYNISELATEMLAGQAFYFKQTAHIEILKTAATYFRGGYDGGNYKISVPTAQKSAVVPLFWYPVGDVSISNLNLYSSSNVGLPFCYMGAASRELKFVNCTTNVVNNDILKVNVGNFGFFVYYSIYDSRSTNPADFAEEDSRLINIPQDLEGQQKVIFENCINYGSVQNIGTCVAAFIGQSIYPTTVLEMKNCINYGDIMGSSQAGLIIGNASALSSYISSFSFDDYILENVFNEGYITADAADIFSDGSTGFSEHFAALIQGNGKIENAKDNAIAAKDLVIYQENGNYYINEGESTAYTYELIFKVQSINYIEGGVSNGRNLVINLEKVSEQIGTVLKTGTYIYAYNVSKALEKGVISQSEADGLSYSYNVEGWEVALITKGDYTYIIFTDDVIVDSPVNCYVYAYTNDGTLIGRKAI